MDNKYGFDHKKSYFNALRLLTTAFQNARETFGGKKEGYRLSPEQIKIAESRLDALYADLGTGENKQKTLVTSAEVYDIYNQNLSAFWSFQQYNQNLKSTPREGVEVSYLEDVSSSMTFEFRTENVQDVSENNEKLPFSNVSRTRCTEFFNALKSAISKITPATKPSVTLSIGTDKTVSYYKMDFYTENAEMYKFPKDFKMSARYISDLSKANRPFTVWLSESTVKAWLLTSKGKSTEALSYCAGEYARQIISKSEFRLHSAVETNTALVDDKNVQHFAKLAVMVSGEALEYPNDVCVYDGGLDRDSMLGTEEASSCSFFHKTFGFSDTVIMMPYDLVPLYFNPTLPFGLLYDYSSGSSPKELSIRTHYTTWFNMRELGYYTLPSDAFAKISTYYKRRTTNVLSDNLVSLGTNGKAFFFDADNSGSQPAEFKRLDLARADRMTQFNPPAHFTEQLHWPYSKDIRGNVTIPQLFTGSMATLRSYKFSGDPSNILGYINSDTGYALVMKNARNIGDVSSRYNASYLTDVRSRLFEYNKFKFASAANSQRSRSPATNESNFRYEMYQDEIKTLCGRYTASTACYDIRNSLLVIGSRAYFSKKPEGGKQAPDAKKKAKTLEDDSLVDMTSSSNVFANWDDSDEDDDDFMDTGSNDGDDDEESDFSDGDDSGDEVSRSGVKRRRDDDAEEGPSFKKQKTTKNSYHKYAKRNKRPKSNDKFRVLARGRKTGKSKWVKVRVLNESASKLMDAIVISKYDPRKRDLDIDKIVVKFSDSHL